METVLSCTSYSIIKNYCWQMGSGERIVNGSRGRLRQLSADTSHRIPHEYATTQRTSTWCRLPSHDCVHEYSLRHYHQSARSVSNDHAFLLQYKWILSNHVHQPTRGYVTVCRTNHLPILFFFIPWACEVVDVYLSIVCPAVPYSLLCCTVLH